MKKSKSKFKFFLGGVLILTIFSIVFFIVNAGNPGRVTDYFDDSNPNNDAEYYIQSMPNLTIDNGRITLLERCREIGDPCDTNDQCCLGNCYRDEDGDGYAATSGVKTCQFSSSDGTDCYDLNADAYPDQIEYFEFDRGDGSYDYDCDGREHRKWSACKYVKANLVGLLKCWRNVANCNARTGFVKRGYSSCTEADTFMACGQSATNYRCRRTVTMYCPAPTCKSRSYWKKVAAGSETCLCK